MAKIQTRWNKVKSGDIISFKYSALGTNRTVTHTILVLDPKMKKTTKEGKKTFLSGLKLEESNIAIFSKATKLTNTLLEYGEIVVVDAKNKIFKVNMGNKSLRDFKTIYKKLKSTLGKEDVYRTYDYKTARKSIVFLESIKIEKKISDLLLEKHLSDNK